MGLEEALLDPEYPAFRRWKCGKLASSSAGLVFAALVSFALDAPILAIGAVSAVALLLAVPALYLYLTQRMIEEAAKRFRAETEAASSLYDEPEEVELFLD